jgi:sugar phosphate isomerase/epimerase
MKIGICSWAFDRAVQGRRPLAEMSAAAAAAGFDALEAAFVARGAAASDGDIVLPATSVATLALHRFPLTAADAARREAGIASVRAMIGLARELGANSISFSPGAAPPQGMASAGISELVPVLRMLVDEAGQAGVRVAVENLPGHVLATREAARQLLAQVPALGLCLDIGNALVDPPVEAWLDFFADDLVKIHLSDGHIDNDQLRPAPLGAGEIRWEDLRPRFQSLGDSVDIYLETPPRLGTQTQTEAVALSLARRSVSEALACG